MPAVPPYPTWTDVVNVAPELSNIPIAAQQAALDTAIEQVSPVAWGTRAFRGIVYLAAHLASLTGDAGVKSESVGSMSRSYASAEGIAGSLGLTYYGAEYHRMVRLLPTALGAVF